MVGTRVPNRIQGCIQDVDYLPFHIIKLRIRNNCMQIGIHHFMKNWIPILKYKTKNIVFELCTFYRIRNIFQNQPEGR
jgi:hypothetical protein